jgi:hypothetical protein
VRAKFLARLGTARVTLQIDVGFGDVVVPAEVWADYPTILDFPAPRIKTYTRESLIAEKLEAMVKLGEINSRMNDFYDVWLLPTVSTFTGALLSEAVRRTFENRRTGLPSAPRFIADTFAESPRQQTQWKAFLSRQRREDVPARFSDVTDAIVAFAGPIFAALARGEALEGEWLPGGPWSGGSA